MAAITSAIITTAAAVYAAKKASEASTHAADTTSQATTHAADLQDEASKRAEAFTRQQAELDWRNQEAARLGNYNLSRARYTGAQTLGQSIGFNLPGMPEYVPSQDPHFDTGQTSLPSTQTTPNSGPTPAGGAPSGAGPEALRSLLASGISPQAAAAQFNQRFGRTTGNEAVYYANNNTVGIPEGYFSTGANGWQFAPRRAGPAPSSTSAPMGTLGSTLTAQAPAVALGGPAPNQPQNPFYQPGTLGFAIGRR